MKWKKKKYYRDITDNYLLYSISVKYYCCCTEQGRKRGARFARVGVDWRTISISDSVSCCETRADGGEQIDRQTVNRLLIIHELDIAPITSRSGYHQTMMRLITFHRFYRMFLDSA